MSEKTVLSTAMREALKYEEETEGADCTIINGAFTTGDLAVEAYFAGRTAPVTELEVRSAALASFETDTDWAGGKPTLGQVMLGWNKLTGDMRAQYVEKARLVLETARKAVGA